MEEFEAELTGREICAGSILYGKVILVQLFVQYIQQFCHTYLFHVLIRIDCTYTSKIFRNILNEGKKRST